MKKIIILFLLCFSLYAEDVSVTSFNIQRFGNKKLNKGAVTDVIAKIIKRSDIIFIQEYQVNDLNLFDEFIQNKLDDKYKFDISERLGSSTYLESFAVLFDKSKFKLISFDKLKLKNCSIARNPYIAHFDKFGIDIIVVHLSPKEVASEMSCLEKSVEDLPQDVMIVGDFNADCSYWRPDYSMFPYYNWLLRKEDTTVASSRCTYDRVLYKGKRSVKAKVFYFDEEYGLDKEKTKKVSDHYPIEILIK